MNFKAFSIFVLALGSSAIGLASTHIGIGLRIGGPPPHRHVERVIVSPGSGYVWVAGHYTWSNNQWAWIPGAWVVPPQPGAMWVEGRWDAATQAWTEGHWEVAQVSAPPPPPTVVQTAPVSGSVIITEAPPPIRHEIRGHRPGRDYVWINGYWGYEHGRHVWVAGRWERPPHGHRTWVEPRWERRGGSYVFIQGRWN